MQVLATLGNRSKTKVSKKLMIQRIVNLQLQNLQDLFPQVQINFDRTNPVQSTIANIAYLNEQRTAYIAKLEEERRAYHVQSPNQTNRQSQDPNWSSVNSNFNTCRFVKASSSVSTPWINFLYCIFSFPTFKTSLLQNFQNLSPFTKYLSSIAQKTGDIPVDPFPPAQNLNLDELFNFFLPTIKQIIPNQFPQQIVYNCPCGEGASSNIEYNCKLILPWKLRAKFDTLLTKFVKSVRCPTCSNANLGGNNHLTPFTETLLISVPTDKTRPVHPPTYFDSKILFPNAPAGYFCFSTSFDTFSKRQQIVTHSMNHSTFYKDCEREKLGPMRHPVEADASHSNFFVYNFVPQKLPPIVPPPPIAFDNDEIELSGCPVWLRFSTRDLYRVIERSCPNVRDHHIVGAKAEILARLRAHKSFRFLPIRDIVTVCNIEHDWAIDVTKDYERIKDQFLQKVTTLPGQEFKNLINECYNQQKKNQVSRQEASTKILLNLTSDEVEVFYKKLMRTLNLTREDRNMANKKDYCATLIQEHYDNPALNEVLRSEYLLRPMRKCVFWPNNETVDANIAKMKEIVLQRHNNQDGKLIFRPDNPVHQQSRLMYTELGQLSRPPTACVHCKQRPYGAVFTDNVCESCQKQNWRRAKYGRANNMDFLHQPNCLRDLTTVEKLAICRAAPLVKIVRVGGKPYKKAGNTIVLSANITNIALTLPRLPQNLEVIVFKSNRGGPLFANRNKILDALTWLKAHNPCYRDIVISEQNLSQYPEDGAVENLRVLEVEPNEVGVGPNPGPGQPVGGADQDSAEEDNEDDELDDEDDEEYAMPGLDPPTVASHHVAAALPARTEADMVQRQLQGLATAANPLDLPERDGTVVSDFSPDFWGMGFPHLFCHNRGGYTDIDRPSRVYINEWVDHLMNWDDGRFTKDPHFLMFLHQFVLKNLSYSQGRLYTSRFELRQEDILNAIDNNDTAAIVDKIQRMATKVPGSRGHCQAESQKAQSYIRLLDTLTEGREQFNFFLTVTSKEVHDTEFLATIPEGAALLAKTLVQNADHIPAGGDPDAYITKAQDHYQRNRLIVEHMHEYTTFFIKKTHLFIDRVLKQCFGVTEYHLRWEFQSRGGLHCHMLLCMPLGIPEDDRFQAFKPVSPTIRKLHEFIKTVWKSEPHATAEDMLRTPEYQQLLQGLEIQPTADALELAIKVLALQQHIIDTVFDRTGITCNHPSLDLGDRFLNHGGTLLTAPSNQCLRQTYDQRIAEDDMFSNLVSFTNKVGTHHCNRGYCQKTVVVDGQQTTGCRFRFPHELVGHQRDADDETGQPTIVRTDPPIKGEVQQVKSLAGKAYCAVAWERNHSQTYSQTPELVLSWGASLELQYCHSPTSVRLYLSKYLAKSETQSNVSRDIMRAAHRRAAEQGVDNFVQKLFREVGTERDYSLAETVFHLGRNKLFEFGREIEVVNTLGGIQIRLPNQEAADGVPQLQTEDRNRKFDQRHDNLVFQTLVDVWNSAPPHDKPYPKDPKRFNLWDYVAYFERDWTPRQTIAVPHFVPFYHSRPGPNHLRKFMISMLRIFNYNITLDELNEMTDDVLREEGDNWFNLENVPAYAVELWWTTEANHQAMLEAFEATEGLDFPPSQQEAPAVDDPNPNNPDPDINVEDVEEINDDILLAIGEDPDNDEDRPNLLETSPNYDRHRDRLRLVPHWTSADNAELWRKDAVAARDPAQDLASIPFDQLNGEQQNVVRWLVDNTVRVVQNPDQQFLLEVDGCAGSGKTTTIQTYRAELDRRLHEINADKSVGEVLFFAAPTGTAAKLLPHEHATLHSMLNLPINQPHSKDLLPLSDTTRRTLQDRHCNIQVIVIDEKSFLSAYYMYMIDRRLREIFAIDKPFGNRSIVIMGDFAQLEPVGGLPLYCPYRERRNISPQQLAGYEAYALFTSVLCLKRSMRQEGCNLLREILDQMGNGPISESQYEILKQRNYDSIDHMEFAAATYLCARKRDYKTHNENKILANPNPRVEVRAENTPPSARCASEDTAGLPNNIFLAEGMEVMLTANVALHLGLSNGTKGVVKGIIYFTDNETEIPTVLVSFPSYQGTHGCLDETTFGPNKVYPVGPISRSWKHTATTMYTRRMLPLMPAYAFSIHRGQGQTLGLTILNLGPQEYSAGLTYTALSRARQLDHLAFRPMPTRDRLNQFSKNAKFGHMKRDKAAKVAKSRATLELAGLAVPEQGPQPE